MMIPALEVLYEDNHLLVVNKPAMLPTMGVSPERLSLLTVAKEYIKTRYRKPGNVYLGILSRLDAPVTGVVLLARTSKAAGRLTEQFRSRAVEKVYWTLVEGSIQPAEGACVDWVGADERHRRMHLVGPTMRGAQQARLSYRRLAVFPRGAVASDAASGATADATERVPPWRAVATSDECSLLEVLLETGRKHQIRLQLAERGHPVLGDRKYGSSRPWPLGIALHARRLTIAHPVGGAVLTFDAPPPKPWRRFPLPG